MSYCVILLKPPEEGVFHRELCTLKTCDIKSVEGISLMDISIKSILTLNNGKKLYSFQFPLNLLKAINNRIVHEERNLPIKIVLWLLSKTSHRTQLIDKAIFNYRPINL